MPDAIKYLAGLQHIRYIFVYPEQKDIVLVGPGEGWKVDDHGNVVGVTTGRPVMLLDDLLVALRTAKDAAQGGITCSINPTKEGLARMNQLRFRAGSDPTAVGEAREKALGMQQISLHGVPETSHFARVLVAADYRMKRISMALDPSPLRGLPSYLGMFAGQGDDFAAVLAGAEVRRAVVRRQRSGVRTVRVERQGDDRGGLHHRQRQHSAHEQSQPRGEEAGPT